MPIIINTKESDQITIDELIETLVSEKIDPSDEDSMTSAGIILKKLANNRTFFADAISKEIRNYKTLQEANSYGAQVFMLSDQSAGLPFFVRACFWPSMRENVLTASGPDPFFYFSPHDHNFNFLTVGYFGPGYWSDYYEYEYEEVCGYPGEDVALKFVERSRLEEGKVMLYRAFKDVHDQLMPDSFSVSINIMEATLRQRRMDQYAFDVKQNKVKKCVNRIGAPALFSAISYMGEEGDREILQHIADRHPSDRVRFCALNALATSKCTAADAIEVLSKIGPSSPTLIREWSKKRIDDLACYV